jgi:hypothetical protein
MGGVLPHECFAGDEGANLGKRVPGSRARLSSLNPNEPSAVVHHLRGRIIYVHTLILHMLLHPSLWLCRMYLPFAYIILKNGGQVPVDFSCARE